MGPGALVAMTNNDEIIQDFRLFQQAFADIGSCLVDMSRILQRGLTPDNEALRGGIACGLERAAAHVRGQRYVSKIASEPCRDGGGWTNESDGLSTYDRAVAGAYALPPQEKPKRPALLAMRAEKLTPDEAVRLSTCITDHAIALWRYHEPEIAYREEKHRMTKQMRSDLEREFKTTGHPKASTLWNVAWENGHAYGLQEVCLHYERLSELVV